MEVPRSLHPNEQKDFQLEFTIVEGSGSTEEKPILHFSRNGFIFEAQLDLLKPSVQVKLSEKRRESFDKDWQVLLPEVQKQAETELQKRREKYSEYFT